MVDQIIMQAPSTLKSRRFSTLRIFVDLNKCIEFINLNMASKLSDKITIVEQEDIHLRKRSIQ